MFNGSILFFVFNGGKWVANGWQITIFQVLKMLKIKDSCGLMP